MARRSVTKERRQSVLDESLDTMFEKRASKRENALASLIQEFNNNVDMQQLDDFVEKNFATILYHCVNSFKKGASKEVSLAARFLGLVALTTIPGGHIAREIRQESISPLSEALRSDSFGLSTYSSLVDCLAMVTFLGGAEKPEETEEAIKILCYLINADDIYDTPPSIIKSVVYAFSLLLTTKDEVSTNPEIWREPICFLLAVLVQEKDTKVWLAAAHALALSFEIPSLNRFLSCLKESDGGDFKREDLKEIVVDRFWILDPHYIYMFDEIVKFLDHNEIPQDLIKCTIKTWGELLQTRFLKHLLGDSNARSSFRRETEDIKYESEHDVEFKYKSNSSFVGIHMTKTEKRLYKSPNSLGNKARTKVLNKKRGVVEDSKAGYYAAAVAEEDV
ncbi:hypothetical protein Leryth_001482 [Lithospermum erythrorhizon]|uniref:Interferon-related developmental regulator N-terminal domain-containing protein n=1 Tax=Lithospermum erythrorhizon TaxID=34254 RepID=A0AAV3P925_LITER|nr:hypothetical protein Leryth_001482 [Lithospermum erythrorhizon]